MRGERGARIHALCLHAETTCCLWVDGSLDGFVWGRDGQKSNPLWVASGRRWRRARLWLDGGLGIDSLKPKPCMWTHPLTQRSMIILPFSKNDYHGIRGGHVTGWHESDCTMTNSLLVPLLALSPFSSQEVRESFIQAIHAAFWGGFLNCFEHFISNVMGQLVKNQHMTLLAETTDTLIGC